MRPKRPNEEHDADDRPLAYDKRRRRPAPLAAEKSSHYRSCEQERRYAEPSSRFNHLDPKARVQRLHVVSPKPVEWIAQHQRREIDALGTASPVERRTDVRTS